jgi:transcriptional regulator with XRE-family HTH domain
MSFNTLGLAGPVRALSGRPGYEYREQVVDTNEYSAEPPLELAGRIRTYRLSHGLTQRDLADRLGVTQQSVARWEQGSPPRRYMLRAIEAILDEPGSGDPRSDLAEIIGIRPPVSGSVPTRGVEDARKVYVQGCLKLLERGERLPNKVLLLMADELGWSDDA